MSANILTAPERPHTGYIEPYVPGHASGALATTYDEQPWAVAARRYAGLVSLDDTIPAEVVAVRKKLAEALYGPVREEMSQMAYTIQEGVRSIMNSTIYCPEDIRGRAKDPLAIAEKTTRRDRDGSRARISDMIGVMLIYEDGTPEEFMAAGLRYLRDCLRVSEEGLHGEPTITKTGTGKSSPDYMGVLQAKLYAVVDRGQPMWFEVQAATREMLENHERTHDEYLARRTMATQAAGSMMVQATTETEVAPA